MKLSFTLQVGFTAMSSKLVPEAVLGMLQVIRRSYSCFLLSWCEFETVPHLSDKSRPCGAFMIRYHSALAYTRLRSLVTVGRGGGWPPLWNVWSALIGAPKKNPLISQKCLIVFRSDNRFTLLFLLVPFVFIEKQTWYGPIFTFPEWYGICGAPTEDPKHAEKVVDFSFRGFWEGMIWRIPSMYQYYQY